MRLFASLFTVIGAVLSLIHYAGLDPKNMLLFSFSVPLWFAPLFADINSINIFLAYALTVASWFVMGYIVDRLVERSRMRRTSR
ncbi:MAG: hypothetical protein J7639_31395 [Paenibacillaceae bacterium]|uniref:hypothetical protein n=1 Tax=Paenibacillus cymbidii TaxID=1639034 RepID=UPI001080D1FE|nr:hypothetical protein [Paenibacillus cymbidii]MBO9610501.1 hypothetical protein [Paenibacillaceae bacterium]